MGVRTLTFVTICVPFLAWPINFFIISPLEHSQVTPVHSLIYSGHDFIWPSDDGPSSEGGGSTLDVDRLPVAVSHWQNEAFLLY